MATIRVTDRDAVSAAQPLGADELAHACGAEIEWVVQLVEVGIVRGRARQTRRRSGGASTAATCNARWRRAGSSATSASGSMPRR